jgi:hypothetical protein
MKPVAKRADLSTRPPARLKTEHGTAPVRQASTLITWKPQSAVLRLGLILVPIVLIGVSWSYYRERSNGAARREAPPAISPPSEVVQSLEIAPAPSNTLELAPDTPDRPAAAASMVQPPPGTPLALAGIDPRLLRALTDRGIAAYGAGSTDAQRIDAAHRIQIAAVLGYGPARALIARDYPRSPAARAAATAPDAVRYTLDVFTGEGAGSMNTDQPFVALATYFAEVKGLATFATHVVGAIRDDRRLQAVASLDLILKSLAAVRGACMAVAREVSATGTAPGSECPPSIRDRVIAHVRAAGLAGREDDARRNALRELAELGYIR